MNLSAFSFRALLAVLAVFFVATTVGAAEVIPPPPTDYFNDGAGIVTPGAADGFNRTLKNFERETSAKVLVVIYPAMQTDAPLEDYCHRVAASWQVGQKGKDNGAVLFVFVRGNQTRIEAGTGLAGVLTDPVCKDIAANVIAPSFKAGDYADGLSEGIEALLQAARGEYKVGSHAARNRQETRILDAGGNTRDRTPERLLDLLPYVGLGLIVLVPVVFVAYTVWDTMARPSRSKKPPAADLPLEVRGNTVYGGRRTHRPPSDDLIGSVTDALLRPARGGRRLKGGGRRFLSSAVDLFFGGGSGGSW